MEKVKHERNQSALAGVLPLVIASTLSVLLVLGGDRAYDVAREQLDRDRAALAAQWKVDRSEARQAARERLLAYLDHDAFPAWSGTPWDFYGTTTTPKEGRIACGYFVTTVLEQAHLKLERVRLAQQASTYLVTTVARGSKVESLRPKDSAEALASMRKKFPGARLLVVGFDLHVGFVRIEGERAQFCHSSYLEPGAVTCEDPLASGAFVSSLYVVADSLNDAVLDDWLMGRSIPSVLPAHPRTR